ncbi:ComEC/Rec2 family competence protein [Microbacterium sp.]|uniref:ComEC/Rec2 family competence protein n=1 Tax=Microbacterium sp. TaxID=51671 RepID=UPI00333E3B9E
MKVTVSGANCAIVVAAAFWLVAICGGGRRTRVVVSLAALAAFVVLVTPEPSVVRAAVMSAFAMITLLLGRPRAGVAMLALAVSVILLADPWLATSPGFALSAAATAALLLLSRPLATGLSRWMPRTPAFLLAVPLSAQLVCGPIIALFSAQQSVIGVAANLLAEPAAPVATVIGLLACLAAPLPPLADLLAAVAWLPSAWIAATATTTSSWPGATAAVPVGPVTALVIAALDTAVAVLIIRPRRRWLRLSAALTMSVLLALAGARVLLGGPLAGMTAPGDWAIAGCDVGQGDAFVVRSEGRIAVIDTGPEPAALASCLSGLGVGRVDLLVLTHFDLDHAGGAAALEGRVSTVLHGPESGQDDLRLLGKLAGGGARIVLGAAGVHGELGGASWRVLWPSAASSAFPPGNDAGVVVEFSGGGVPRSLFLADLSAASQAPLLASGRVRGSYAVVKVSHHGSRDQDPRLYAALHARLALIGVGEGNRYGHPRSETLAFLAAEGIPVLRTDLHGRVLVGIRPEGLAVWAERGEVGSSPPIP